MRRTTVTTALLLALSLAPALQAQYRDNRGGYPDQDRYRNDSRYGRGQRIDAVADEIADVAYSIRREYERNNRRPDRDEARVLYALRELDNRAHRFQTQTDDRGYGSRQNRTNDEFAALENAYFDLAESLRYISARPYVDRGMDRISSLMRDASRYYGRDGRGSRYDRYGRGGDWHDRYGRDGRYRDDDAYRTRPPAK
jgi:hypothetical protein